MINVFMPYVRWMDFFSILGDKTNVVLIGGIMFVIAYSMNIEA